MAFVGLENYIKRNAKIIVYKKYQKNCDKLPINIKELDEEYDRLSTLITYSK